MKKNRIKNIENKSVFMLDVLKKKRLYYLIDPFVEVSHLITKYERRYLAQRAKEIKSYKYEKLVIKYLEKYSVSYPVKEQKKRVPEKKENVSSRQKKYVEKQKRLEKKKLQVYISSHIHEMLVRMCKYTSMTQRDIIENAILTKSWCWDK